MSSVSYNHFANGTTKVCVQLPPHINSFGIWENTTSPPSAVFNYSLPNLELQMLLIFLVTQLVYFLLRPVQTPTLPAQILAGFILGPKLLGKIGIFEAVLFPSKYSDLEIIDTTAIFGFTIFLFLMGVKMDVKVAFQTVKRAKVIGFASLLSPLIVGLIIAQWIMKTPQQPELVRIERFNLVTCEALTSISVIACLLTELKILNSELGRLALSSAVVGNLTGLPVIIGMISYAKWTVSRANALLSIGTMILLIILLIFVLRPLMFWIIRRTPEGKPVKNKYIFAIMLLALGSGLYSSHFNDSAVLGAFLFGLAVPNGPPLGSALVDKFECFVSGVFLPVYVATVTMRADPIKMLSSPAQVKFAAIIAIGTFLSKFIGCFIPAIYSKMPLKDSLAFALIMSSKGIVELSFYTGFRDYKIIQDASFSVMVLSILLNSSLVPVLVKYLYDPIARKYAGYQKRNIMHLKPNNELRILACVYKPYNVAPMIGLLNATSPVAESPNVVYVLHLMELMGSDAPVFIAHQKQEAVSGSSYENVILAFNQYEQNNWGLVTLNAFTAISPAKLMHDDISMMALDKQTSIILLPFHRSWAIDGSVEAEDNSIRNLNCSVLEKAPCSVGILVDRGSMSNNLLSKTSTSSSASSSSLSSFCIGMIFLGGKDDREALTLAKRMRNDPRVNLTVIRFVEEDSGNMMLNWDQMLDDQVLKDVKHCGDDHNTTYMEEVVREGTQAAQIVRSIVYEYDLIIVGRRYGLESAQTSGLSEWNEFPELGVIGDILASPDLPSITSVLVVQQQNYVDVDKN